MILLGFSPQISVSTHSHPKVAAISFHYKISFCCCFNTQPPEGGCKAKVSYNTARRWFQHTATRRWLPLVGSVRDFMSFVSTHSHPKVAALYPIRPWWTYLSFNTQPPEGGCKSRFLVSTKPFGFNTQPPEGGCLYLASIVFPFSWFQHTATRRWLRSPSRQLSPLQKVSTHSHPKVAAVFIF